MQGYRSKKTPSSPSMRRLSCGIKMGSGRSNVNHQFFGPFDAGSSFRQSKDALFRKTGRIQQFVRIWGGWDLSTGEVRKRQPQRIFLEVFPTRRR